MVMKTPVMLFKKLLRRFLPAALIAVTLAGWVPLTHVSAAPPDAYWVGGTGNWTDATNHWAVASGGAPGAGNTPDATTNTHFDVNSFSGASQSVTLDAAANCQDMDWTGATNTPTLTASVSGINLTVNGNATFIAAMSITGIIGVLDDGLAMTGGTLTTNGLNLAFNFLSFVTGTTIFADNVTTATQIFLTSGTLNTNGKTLNSGSFQTAGAGAKTLTLGVSILNVTKWDMVTGGGAVTLTANTATINVSGTGVFAGGNIATYNNINLNGTAHTVSGAFTAAAFSLASGTTQTITFTDATTYTAAAFTLSGSSGHVHTLQGSGVGGWTLSQAAGTVNADYISISRSTAGGGATFNAVGVSVNGGNNVGWNFPQTVSSQAATGVTMDKDGVTGGTFNGTLTDLGGAPASTTVRFDYGLTAAYGSATADVAKTTAGAYTATIPVGLTPGQTYHFRASTTNGTPSTAVGADQPFTFTMPTVTTGTATNVAAHNVTLNGNLTALGVASNTNIFFQYGLTAAYGSTTAIQVKAAPTAISATVSGLSLGQTYHYRAVAQNGAVTSVGADQTATLADSASRDLIDNLLRVVLAAAILIGVVISTGLDPKKMLVGAVVGLLCYALIAALLGIL